MKSKESWDIAFGLAKVHGEIPSEYIINLAEDEVKGKINIDDIEEKLNKKNKVI